MSWNSSIIYEWVELVTLIIIDTKFYFLQYIELYDLNYLMVLQVWIECKKCNIIKLTNELLHVLNIK